MPLVVARPRPDLFSQKQAADILEWHPHTVGDLVRDLGICRKTDPTRPNAALLDRSDIDRLATLRNRQVDWSTIVAA